MLMLLMLLLWWCLLLLFFFLNEANLRQFDYRRVSIIANGRLDAKNLILIDVVTPPPSALQIGHEGWIVYLNKKERKSNVIHNQR